MLKKVKHEDVLVALVVLRRDAVKARKRLNGEYSAERLVDIHSRKQLLVKTGKILVGDNEYSVFGFPQTPEAFSCRGIR